MYDGGGREGKMEIPDRISHRIRHTEALAGRRHLPHASNERLRYMLKGIEIAGRRLQGSRNRNFPAGSGKAHLLFLDDFNLMPSAFCGA